MTVTHVAVDAGAFTRTWDVTSSADGDLTDVIVHGFIQPVYTPVAPKVVCLTPLQPQAYLKRWTLGVVDTVNININAISATGGGLASTPQLRVIAMIPHSIVE
jgi:hypothetical protein